MTVSAYKANPLTTVDVDSHLFEKGLGSVRFGEVFDLEHGK